MVVFSIWQLKVKAVKHLALELALMLLKGIVVVFAAGCQERVFLRGQGDGSQSV